MEIIKIKKDDLRDLAEKFFLQSSGINKNGNKYERMKKEAFKMLEVAEEKVDLKAAYKYFDEFEIEERKLAIGGIVLECNAFERLEKREIKGVYVYALSVGDFDFPEKSLIEQVYADIWGNAFVDAARILMKEKFEENGKLSDSFGPGFYGMKVEEVRKFARLLNMEEIGIEIRNEQIMVPLKTCVGVYFYVTERYEKLDEACLNCFGNKMGCKQCRVREGIN